MDPQLVATWFSDFDYFTNKVTAIIKAIAALGKHGAEAVTYYKEATAKK